MRLARSALALGIALAALYLVGKGLALWREPARVADLGPARRGEGGVDAG